MLPKHCLASSRSPSSSTIGSEASFCDRVVDRSVRSVLGENRISPATSVPRRRSSSAVTRARCPPAESPARTTGAGACATAASAASSWAGQGCSGAKRVRRQDDAQAGQLGQGVTDARMGLRGPERVAAAVQVDDRPALPVEVERPARLGPDSVAEHEFGERRALCVRRPLDRVGLDARDQRLALDCPDERSLRAIPVRALLHAGQTSTSLRIRRRTDRCAATVSA